MPNDNDLIERYLYAITRHLPSAQRSDVAEELRTLISDMLDERCGSLPPTAKDVREPRARWCASTRAGKGNA